MTKLLRPSRRPSRRAVLAGGTAFAASLAMPAISRASARPVFTHGVQSGDVDTMSGMIWTRTDRPAQVMMEVSTTESFANARQLAPLTAAPESDFAVKRLVEGLPSDQDIFYRFVAADLNDMQATSDPIVGQFRTAPASRRDVESARAAAGPPPAGSAPDVPPNLSYATARLSVSASSMALSSLSAFATASFFAVFRPGSPLTPYVSLIYSAP